MTTVADLDIQPGDVLDFPSGINREITRGVMHSVHRYEDGSVATRWRYESNPRGVDWRGFLASDEEVTLVERGRPVDENVRSLLP